jgi:tRNA (guanine-N7-)-methyltransferase
MAKKKLLHLAELETFTNVFQHRKDLMGKWNAEVFKNENPITLELACGKGEYTLALAKKYTDRNFIGIDIKGARLWKGAKKGLEEQLNNAVFLRTYIDHITDYFEENEVAEIWITFPDPYLEKSKVRKRLTSEVFLKRYRQILRSGGFINLKTDDLTFYLFTLDTISQLNYNLDFFTENLYNSNMPDEILFVKTFYELQHLANGRTIKYIRFSL